MKHFIQFIFLWATLSSTHCFWWMYGNNISECPSDLTSSATLLPDKDDCQRYFACAHGRKIPRSCPDGLLFNPKVQVCDYPHNVNCPIKECPPSDVSGQTVLLPDPNNCGKFFICTHGKKVPMSCPPTLHFNPNLNVCDYAHKVQCETANYGTKALQNTQKICDGSKVYVPHEYECSKYYMCSNGISHLITCPSGLHFDIRINVCNWPADAGCDQSAYSDDVVEDQFYNQNELINNPIVTDDVPFVEWLKHSTTERDENVKFTGSSEPRASKDPGEEETQEIENNIQPIPGTYPLKPSTAPSPTEGSNIGGIIQTIASQILDFFTGGDDSEETDDEDEDEKLLRKIATEETLDRIKDLLSVLADEVKENTLKNHHLEINENKETGEDDSVSDDNVSTTTDYLPIYMKEPVEIQNSFPDREETQTILIIKNLTTSTEISVSTINSLQSMTHGENVNHDISPNSGYLTITTAVLDKTPNSISVADIDLETTPQVQDIYRNTTSTKTVDILTTILMDTTQTSTTTNDIDLKTLTDLKEISHSTQTSITVTDINSERTESDDINYSTLKMTENTIPISVVLDTIQTSAITLEASTTIENSNHQIIEDVIQGRSLVIECTTPTLVMSDTIQNSVITIDHENVLSITTPMPKTTQTSISSETTELDRTSSLAIENVVSTSVVSDVIQNSAITTDIIITDLRNSSHKRTLENEDVQSKVTVTDTTPNSVTINNIFLESTTKLED